MNKSKAAIEGNVAAVQLLYTMTSKVIEINVSMTT